MSKAAAVNALYNNKKDIDHSQSDATLNKTPKAHKNTSLLSETPAYEANEFPRAASNALLVEQTSSDEDQQIDFSVEREILKKQLKKSQEKTDSDGHLKAPCEIHHKDPNSMLDACEDCEEDEDQIVRALDEIDNNKN